MTHGIKWAKLERCRRCWQELRLIRIIKNCHYKCKECGHNYLVTTEVEK